MVIRWLVFLVDVVLHLQVLLDWRSRAQDQGTCERAFLGTHPWCLEALPHWCKQAAHASLRELRISQRVLLVDVVVDYVLDHVDCRQSLEGTANLVEGRLLVVQAFFLGVSSVLERSTVLSPGRRRHAPLVLDLLNCESKRLFLCCLRVVLLQVQTGFLLGSTTLQELNLTAIDDSWWASTLEL